MPYEKYKKASEKKTLMGITDDGRELLAVDENDEWTIIDVKPKRRIVINKEWDGKETEVSED